MFYHNQNRSVYVTSLNSPVYITTVSNTGFVVRDTPLRRNNPVFVNVEKYQIDSPKVFLMGLITNMDWMEPTVSVVPSTFMMNSL